MEDVTELTEPSSTSIFFTVGSTTLWYDILLTRLICIYPAYPHLSMVIGRRRRILDIIEQERPEIILIDELDKMGKTFQNQLLNFLESGRIVVTQRKKQYDFEIKGAKVFASANEINRISKPLQSRFRRLFLPRYTEQQFIEVSVKVLKNVSDSLARYIGVTVFKDGGDIRDVVSVGRLVKRADTSEDVNQIISTLMRYGKEKEKGGK